MTYLNSYSLVLYFYNMIIILRIALVSAIGMYILSSLSDIYMYTNAVIIMISGIISH